MLQLSRILTYKYELITCVWYKLMLSTFVNYQLRYINQIFRFSSKTYEVSYVIRIYRPGMRDFPTTLLSGVRKGGNG